MSDRVAIACQGGGSHTAFTAGVLSAALERYDEWGDLVGISGTSGGAINAVTAWYGLHTGGPEHAADLLESLWDDIAADGAADRLRNAALVWTTRLEASGFPVPTVSPYQIPGARTAQEDLRDIVESYVDFGELRSMCGPDRPALVVGTVNVEAGTFETFTDEDITADAVLASAAVPVFFPAVTFNGHAHWDGLFSQNPPVHELFTQPADRKPDDIWVVQINPQERDGEPTTIEEIADRRNELAGNISLNQELRFVDTVNDWIAEGKLSGDSFTQIDIHRIELGDVYHSATKVDRSRAFLDELYERGHDRATGFLDAR